MLKNYLTIALRNLRRHKGYAFINIAGLAVGIACCLLILLYVQDERSFDRFHEQGDRIVRVSQHVTQGDLDERWAWSGGGLAPDLQRDFPQIQATVRFHHRPGIVRRESAADDLQSFRETYVLYTDPNVFEVFTFPLQRGDPQTALQDPASVVLTASTAEKYFGATDPIGQTLYVEGRPYTVSGIAEDVPATSQLRFDVLLPLNAFKALYGIPATSEFDSYWWPSVWTYALLSDANAELSRDELAAFSKRNREPSEAEDFTPVLERLYDIHLHSAASGEQEIPGPSSDLATVRLFALIALAVLLLACINFMNLATARSARRAKEVGVRKVIGAQRGQLIRQFLGESVLLSLLALGIAVALVELALPFFNHLIDRDLTIHYAQNGTYGLGLLVLVLLTGLVAGSYPALYLSRFRPARVLKGASAAGNARLRKMLVVFQFGISIVLVTGTVIAGFQLRYLQNARLGFDRDELVVVRLQGGVEWPSLQRELRADGAVRDAVMTSVPPGVGRGTFMPYQVGPIDADDPDPASIGLQFVDYGFFEMLGVDLVAGRTFDPAYLSDQGVLPPDNNASTFHLYERAYVINEAAARYEGWTPEEAIGQQLRIYTYENGTYYTDLRGTIVGVVADFNHSSLHEPIGPMVFSTAAMPGGYYGGWALVKVAPGNLRTAMERIEATWHRVAPAAPFEAFFLNDELDNLYLREARLSQVIGALAFVGLFIACLGLFGLAAYAAEQRTKEIGIRKVMGASVAGLVGLLSKDFLRLVLLAAVLALPLAYVVMDRWLADFAYRVTITPLLFVGIGGSALLLAFATVGYQAFRTARMDPVRTLRHE